MGTAWEVWKDVLYPGRITVAGADGEPVSYTFRNEDVSTIERNGNAKLADSWNIPVCWEHQDVEPVRLSQAEKDRRMAQGVFGDAGKFRTQAGRLQVLLKGDDEADYKQFQKVKFVSPEIQWDWMDSDGHVWNGPTITHIAATPRPVQRHQEPVGAIRLSFPGAKSLSELFSTLPKTSRVAGRLRLSLANYEGTAVADDLDIASLSGDGKKGKGSPWERIAASLLKIGVKIGDGGNIKDPDHLADLIDVACMNSEAAAPEEDELLPSEEDDAPPEGDMEQPPEGATEAPPPPVQMSHTNKLVEVHREKLVAAAVRLGKKGYVPPTVANDIETRAKKVRLSLKANGDLEMNPVLAEILAYQKLAPNTAWAPKGDKKPAGKPGVRLSQTAKPKRETVEVERSQWHEDGDQDTDSVVDAYERNVGRASGTK